MNMFNKNYCANEGFLSRGVAASILNAGYDHIQKICYPLFKSTPLRYFDYVRYYDSGEAIAFSTSTEFSINTLSETLLPTFEELNLTCLFGQKASFLSTAASLPLGINDLNREKYEKNLAYAIENKVYHRLYITERGSDCYVTCGFGVTNDSKSVINFHMNAIGYLQKFINYFEFHASDLIHEHSLKYRFNIQNYHSKIIQEYYDFDFSFLKVADAATQSVVEKNDNDMLVLISPREKKCLELMALGYTMKNAARKLDISPRTVEQHIRNIKDKLGLSTKNQLVEIWHQRSIKFNGVEHDSK